MKLLVPTAAATDLEVPDLVELVRYDPEGPVPAEHADAVGLVAWGNAAGTLEDAARRLTSLRWVQGLAAGPDSVLAAGFAPDVVLCSGVGLHTPTVTEHALALVLALVRRLPASAAAQAEQRWARELGGTQPLHPPGPVTTLLDARVTVWGFGAIGQRLGQVLAGLGAHVTGVARTAGERGGLPVVGPDGLDEVLAATDVLVLVLPSGPATDSALDARRLTLLPDHAYVVNVGRGSTVDEDALVSALRAGTLAGAALDVAATEPLPPGSPLWDAPHLVLTPHAAGGRPVGAAALIRQNLDALLAGRPLRNVLPR
ncbi:NAD(P)-dependent oxidoreductase [Cellulomonas marina]|uniref:Phosphoglycerate dehydrogenase n=1 Tax=Cellulomonas marina TaxID=988821 RepID=A0A1I0Y1K3_9CELL|nr:NAD(P)-dependent oxidoreductase [Cellulomonas marina]GIG28398.1 phosphoglycerate dehydrogenase [Cellulomonas marina]SFB07165.1 Phosphoglycerate dehydrogenase [Cellulomonas marina]